VLESAADPTRHVAAAEIAQKYGVSAHHLAKVLAELARAGILESVRGAGGGYRFAANPRRLTLLDVVQHFEELTATAPGRDPGERTPVGRALLTVLAEIDDIARATFSTITVATMLRIIERQRETTAPSTGETSRRSARRRG